MAIEKVFAIEEKPGPIWDQLWAEVQGSSPANFVLEESHRPRLLVLRLDLAGMPARVRYEIEDKGDVSEVLGSIEPLGFRYKLFQVLSFGHMRVNYEMMLAAGLANLKTAVESPPAGPDASFGE